MISYGSWTIGRGGGRERWLPRAGEAMDGKDGKGGDGLGPGWVGYPSAGREWTAMAGDPGLVMDGRDGPLGVGSDGRRWTVMDGDGP